MRKISSSLVIGILIIAVAVVTFRYLQTQSPAPTLVLPAPTITIPNPTAATVYSPRPKKTFTDNFSGTAIISETARVGSSGSPNWWLSSGGSFNINNGTAQTIQGDLPQSSKWQNIYAESNSIDTDSGLHPQNIFRLTTKTQWLNFTQQAYFKINKDNLSDSPQRNESNGLFFFNRYVDENNTYYTGIRVDGGVVVKKKINGVYYTLAYQQHIPGSYSRETNPNLLPKQKWIGLKSEVQTNNNNEVQIKVFVDIGKTGDWKLILDTVDSPKRSETVQILDPGYGGIRTDFMDVEFADFRIEEF